MIKTLKAWLGICDHEWKIIQQGTHESRRPYETNSRCVGYWYHSQCAKCGHLKEDNFKY